MELIAEAMEAYKKHYGNHFRRLLKGVLDRDTAGETRYAEVEGFVFRLSDDCAHLEVWLTNGKDNGQWCQIANKIDLGRLLAQGMKPGKLAEA